MGYLNLVNSFIYKEPLFRSKLDALAENDAQLKTDGWAQNTKTLFFQSAVPTGWTQDVSQNDKALRIVGPTVGGGSGGATGISNLISLAHTHTVSSDDAHSHNYPAHTHTFFSSLGSGQNPTSEYVGDFSVMFTPIGSGSATYTDALQALMVTPSPVIALGSVSAHNHGGVTDSQLSNVTLAYCDIIIGTKNAPGGTYTDLTSFWNTGDKIDFDPFVLHADNDDYNFRNLMPVSTVSIFGQASAPTGWSKISGLDDRMLRVVSGVGSGSGGSHPISSGLSLAHPHSLTVNPDHTHTIPSHHHLINKTFTTSLLGDGSTNEELASSVQADGSGNLMRSGTSGTVSTAVCYKTRSVDSGGTTTAAGAHTHDIPSALADTIFAYVDVIQCSKSAAGASPNPYTDYTSEFTFKKLVSKQRLNTLASNDAYIEFHTTPSGSTMFFFMATAPAGWGKITTQNDKSLRIVAGGSGGSPGGGSQGMSQIISLAHPHTIVAAGTHQHMANHTHLLDSDLQNAFPITTTAVFARGTNQTMGAGSSGGGFLGKSFLCNVSNNPLEIPDPDPDHSHGGLTGSALTDLQLAYIDVIWCLKS